MFNLSKKTKVAQAPVYEKNLRQDKIGPVDNDGQSIYEKELPHRDGEEKKVPTQGQFGNKHTVNDDSQIIEKVLSEAKSYVTHRTDKWSMPITPMSAVVEKMRQDRLSEDWKPEKTSHWSQTYNEKKQQGSLPKWPKNAPQSSAITLGNDPRRFEGMEGLPVHADQRKNDAEHGKNVNIKPLVGNITTASITKVAHSIKAGEGIDYDKAVVAILREAEKEKRELTKVEQKTISELKIARTKSLLK